MTRRARPRTPRDDVVLRDAGLVLAAAASPSIVEGLTVAVEDAGLRVVSPTGRPISTIPWTSITAVALDIASPDAVAAPGPEAETVRGQASVDARVALVVAAGGRRHRFLAPEAEATAFCAGVAPRLHPDGPGAGDVVRAGARGRLAGAVRPLGAAAARELRRIVLGLGAVAVLALTAPRRRRRRPAHGTAGLWIGPRSRTALGGNLFRSSVRPVPLHAVTSTRVPRPRRREVRVTPVMACAGSLVLVMVGGALGSLGTGGAVAATQPPPTSAGQGQGVTIMHRMEQAFATSPATVVLPPATTPPQPAPPSLAGAPALRAHEIFAFAPYWTLPQAGSFDVGGVTTLAYFSVDVNGDGTIVESGPGWAGYQSQDLADLVTRAHAAGARVVLTATCFGQKALDQLAADPTSGGRLGASLVQLVEAKHLDGVNIDFEGKGPADRAGLDTLMAAVSSAVHQADPHFQLTMDTYASSAGDPTGFYDVAGLAPSVDAFFVMAYDMNSPTAPSPTAPLTGTGFTDLDAAQQYVAAVGAGKVILGVPYYGYDWPTAGPGLGDPATGPATPLSYAAIAAQGAQTYWDPVTETPWSSYQVGTQWHQTFFDNPTSLALKAQLANTYHLAGLGIWAMGMEGDAPAMLAALRGNAPVVKNLPKGPAATHPGAPPTPPHYFYSGSWNGAPVTLKVVAPGDAPTGGLTPDPSALVGFATNDPSVNCLENGPALAVSALDGAPGTYVVVAAVPADCAGAMWEFTVSPSPAPPSSTTTTPTTTTTAPPDTSTTSSTSTTTTSP